MVSRIYYSPTVSIEVETPERRTRAETLLLQEAAARPQDTLASFALGLLYLKQGRIEEARENLQRAIEINPDIECRKFNGLARIYLDEGRYDEAEKLLCKSQQNFPNDDEAEKLLTELARLRSGAAK